MRRSRARKESFSAASSIPRISINNRRSSSVDCVIRRGSYLPSNSRGSSVERYRTPVSAMKYPRASPRVSLCSFLPPQRGSFFERKRSLKDQRPLSEKSYQKQCINSLVEFLEDSNFPFSISPANLMPPQKKDFEKIFQFLCNFLDPKYEVRKIEEEAPKILKGLGYPFTLTKSTFLSITRMSWPTLLGTLMWLMELNKFAASTTFEHLVADDFEEAEKQNILMNFILQSYKAGVDDSAKDEEIFTNLAIKKCNDGLSTKEVVERISQLEVAIDKKKKEQMEYCRLEEYIKDAEHDKQIYQEFVSKMINHIKQKEETLQEVKEQQIGKENELKNLANMVSEKDALYKAQGYDGHFAQNFYCEKKRKLQEKLDEKERCFKDGEEACWNLEMKLCELRDKLDAVCQDFNLAWEDLRNATESALTPLNSTTMPAAVKLCKEYKVMLPEFQIPPASIQDIKLPLDKVKTYTEEQRERINNIVMVQERHISELEMKISDISIKIKMSAAMLTQKERELEIKASEDQTAVDTMQLECDMLEKKLKTICEENLKKKQNILDLKKYLEEQKVKLAKSKSCSKKAVNEATECSKEVAKFVQGTCEEINSEAMKLYEKMRTLLQKIKENPL